MGAALLTVVDLSVAYAGRRRGLLGGAEPKEVVRGFTTTLERGRTLAVVGESGSGKTSAIRAISGRAPIAGGTVTIDGRDVGAMSRVERSAVFQFIPQDSRGSLDPRRTALWSAAQPLVTSGVGRDEAERAAAEALLSCGLVDVQHHKRPHELSGGQVKRVCIARALVRSPELIIADEPTAGLDVTVQAQILGLLQSLQASRGLSMLLVTHDIGVVRQLATDMAVMYRGDVVETGPVDEVLREPRHEYTRRLIEAAPGLHD
ncbi:ATP-binding cassette domain-containing protein [Nocardioides sp.]|uniref:ATP-binding cassette domain-containing protein n=1 Tax=Nocardioides sp. TaxID=35761 RepID=UPI0039E279CF